MALLGEAHSIATAPRGSLPAYVRPITRALVTQHARELSTAGLRLALSYRLGLHGTPEPLPEGLLLTLQDVFFDWLDAGTFDLGVVVPGSDGELRQVTFRGLTVTAGEVITATVRPRTTPLVVLERGGATLAPTAEDVIPDGPPQVLGVVQQADRTVDAFGRVVAVLFDKDVDRSSAQVPAAYQVNPTAIPLVPPPSPLVASVRPACWCCSLARGRGREECSSAWVPRPCRCRERWSPTTTSSWPRMSPVATSSRPCAPACRPWRHSTPPAVSVARGGDDFDGRPGLRGH